MKTLRSFVVPLRILIECDEKDEKDNPFDLEVVTDSIVIDTDDYYNDASKFKVRKLLINYNETKEET